VRFLVDQNVPDSVTDVLREAGHDAHHARDLGLARAEDEDVLAVAKADGRVVITFDSDFSRFLALSGDDAPSVVHLRLGPEQLPDLAGRVRRAVTDLEAALAAGAIVVVEPHRVRSRRLPIG